MTKREQIAEALRPILGDEPFFLIRGQDRVGPATVRDWAHRATNVGASAEKVQSAMAIAVEMQRWQDRTGIAKCPD